MGRLRRRAAPHEGEREIGGLRAGRLDDLYLVRVEGRQHVVDDLLPVLAGSTGPPDADLDAADLVRPERLNEGTHAVVTARAAVHPNADLAERQVEIVEDDDEVRGAEVELPADARQRRPGQVHEGAELDEVERFAVPPAGRHVMAAFAGEARVD